jgi:thiamine biosynthesis lipoprotein
MTGLPAVAVPDTAEDSPFHRRMQPCLGTFVEVAVAAASAQQAGALMERGFEALHTAQRLWSFHDRNSELSRLNGSPGQDVPLSPLTLRLLRLARGLMLASHGAFDITVGGLLVQQGRLPDHGGSCLPAGTVDDIELQHGSARLRRPVRLTLDGVAKGFAVDLAVAALRRAGARAGWVNAGGDLRAFGGVTVPLVLRDEQRRLLPAGGLRDRAIATSVVRSQMQSKARSQIASQVQPTSRPEPQDDSFAAHIVANGELDAEPGTWSVLSRYAWRADALTKVAACTPAAVRARTLQRLGGQWVQLS